jgi:hypothetical protein
MSNATETTVAKTEKKKKAGCCGGADAKEGDRPAATVPADEAKSASHAAHDHGKRASGAGCCGGGGKARK